jgi:ABC-type sugar transport system permease subunit
VRFGDGSLGAGSAVAFLLFLIVLVLTWLQFRVFRDEQERS